MELQEMPQQAAAAINNSIKWLLRSLYNQIDWFQPISHGQSWSQTSTWFCHARTAGLLKRPVNQRQADPVVTGNVCFAGTFLPRSLRFSWCRTWWVWVFHRHWQLKSHSGHWLSRLITGDAAHGRRWVQRGLMQKFADQWKILWAKTEELWLTGCSNMLELHRVTEVADIDLKVVGIHLWWRRYGIVWSVLTSEMDHDLEYHDFSYKPKHTQTHLRISTNVYKQCTYILIYIYIYQKNIYIQL